jgi:hypothetical protein
MVCACFVWNEDDEIRRSLSMILPNRIFVWRPAQYQLIVLLSRSMGIGTTVRAAALAASGFVPQQMQRQQTTRPPAALSSSTGASMPSLSTAAVNVHNSGMTRGGAAMK